MNLPGAEIAGARASARQPVVRTFFDEPTFTATHVVHHPALRVAAIIDLVLNYDAAAGRTAHKSADAIVDYVQTEGLSVAWHLETHAHADHLSAAPYLQERLGGALAIGQEIIRVQTVFGKIFNAGSEFVCDGSQFDRLLKDGDSFKIGELSAIALHVSGHTPADMAFVIGDAAFVGETPFMPDYGTARADFPGGDAHQLYRSIRRLLSLPDATRLFLCHDYKAPGRDDFVWETSVGAERAANVHVHDGIDEDEVRRDARGARRDPIDAATHIAIRANQYARRSSARARANGTRYLKIPLDTV